MSTFALQVLETTSLPVAQIKLHPIFQPRKGLSSDALSKYEEAIAEELSNRGETSCPPIDVLVHEGEYYLIHGHHRLQVFLNLQQELVPAVLYSGSWNAAVQFAMTANIFNGLQLSKKEVAIACRRFLEVNDALPQEEKLSDRAIAKKFLVSPKSIRNYRQQNIVAKLAFDWREGKTVLLHKGHKRFHASLQQFCYATYGGSLDVESFEAFFIFDHDVCFTTGYYSIYDFVVPESPPEFSVPEVAVGSVVWLDTYYRWGVVYQISQVDDSTVYFCLSWDRGLCRVYDVLPLTSEQAEAISLATVPFFPLLDFEQLIEACITRLQVLIAELEDEIAQDIDPLFNRSMIKHHQKDIQRLESMLLQQDAIDTSEAIAEPVTFPATASAAVPDVNRFIDEVVEFFTKYGDRISSVQAQRVIAAAQAVLATDVADLADLF